MQLLFSFTRAPREAEYRYKSSTSSQTVNIDSHGFPFTSCEHREHLKCRNYTNSKKGARCFFGARGTLALQHTPSGPTRQFGSPAVWVRNPHRHPRKPSAESSPATNTNERGARARRNPWPEMSPYGPLRP
ncbi:hypothetical protein D187_002650 [Cystobacter fuscus DSM 2262]|uniref:Uncharacterized protein n=1 Tax=Cystobacter fuscus (strain ATCC 25194 / DSM 2262 / NBRC 100088 / M29) TaxID=1242864 RepID=S9P9T6_CYSF2|nr:hypothetical protein D187_002650 [Cystobacter fuscus DSM 2262]